MLLISSPQPAARSPQPAARSPQPAASSQQPAAALLPERPSQGGAAASRHAGQPPVRSRRHKEEQLLAVAWAALPSGRRHEGVLDTYSLCWVLHTRRSAAKDDTCGNTVLVGRRVPAGHSFPISGTQAKISNHRQRR